MPTSVRLLFEGADARVRLHLHLQAHQANSVAIPGRDQRPSVEAIAFVAATSFATSAGLNSLRS